MKLIYDINLDNVTKFEICDDDDFNWDNWSEIEDALQKDL